MRRVTSAHSSFYHAQQSKGGQTRTVYLNQRFRKALLEYSACIRITDPQRPLVCEPKRRALFSEHNVSAVLGYLQSCWAQGRVKPLRDARTYITRLANKGVGVRLLAELAGHSHISTTQRYIDVNAEQLSEAVELL